MEQKKEENNGKRGLLFAAVVMGFFTLALLAGLALFYLAHKDLVISVSSIPALKAELEKDPENEVLKEKIRETDRRERAGYFGMLDLIEKGKYPLAGFFVLFVLLLKVYFPSTPQPMLKDHEVPPAWQKRRFAVLSLSGTFILLCAFMLISAFFDTSRYLAELKPVLEPESEWDEVYPAPTDDKETEADGWPAFRGPKGDSLAGPGDYPVKFDYASGENIIWKAALGVTGYSSPVICGDRLYLSGASKSGALELACYDINSGSILWQKEAAPKIKKELNVMSEKDGGAGLAAPTPVCDGKYIYLFSPKADLFCFSVDGKQVWAVDLGMPESIYGLAVSPLLAGDMVIIQADKLKEGAVIAAFNKKDGKLAWKKNRKVQSSWSTPSLIDLNGTKCIVAFAEPDAVAYTLDGAEVWRAPVISGEISSSPASVSGNVIVASNMYLYALDPGGKQIWEAEKDTTVNSPVTDGKRIILAQAGSLACFDAANGKQVFKHEIEGDFYATPVIAKDICYAPGLDGRWYIFKYFDKYEPLAEINTSERTAASPAFVNGRIYVRTEKNIYCIGKTIKK